MQCNIPTTLAVGNFRCFSLISTILAVVIAIATSYRFKCKLHTGWSPIYLLVGKCHILGEVCVCGWGEGLQKNAYFSNGDYSVHNFSCQSETGFNRILKGFKCNVSLLANKPRRWRSMFTQQGWFIFSGGGGNLGVILVRVCGPVF